MPNIEQKSEQSPNEEGHPDKKRRLCWELFSGESKTFQNWFLFLEENGAAIVGLCLKNSFRIFGGPIERSRTKLSRNREEPWTLSRIRPANFLKKIY